MEMELVSETRIYELMWLLAQESLNLVTVKVSYHTFYSRMCKIHAFGTCFV